MIENLSYKEARQRFRTGDIVFVKNTTNKITSFLIHTFTRSEYVHVGIAVWVQIGLKYRLMMVEAQGGSPRRILNMSYYNGADMDVYESPKPWGDVASKALDQLGVVRYGWFEAIYVGLRESLLKYFNFNLLPRLNFPGEICSEFVAKTYELPKVHVSPQIVKEQLEELNCRKRLSIIEQAK